MQVLVLGFREWTKVGLKKLSITQGPIAGKKEPLAIFEMPPFLGKAGSIVKSGAKNVGTYMGGALAGGAAGGKIAKALGASRLQQAVVSGKAGAVAGLGALAYRHRGALKKAAGGIGKLVGIGKGKKKESSSGIAAAAAPTEEHKKTARKMLKKSMGGEPGSMGAFKGPLAGMMSKSNKKASVKMEKRPALQEQG